MRIPVRPAKCLSKGRDFMPIIFICSAPYSGGERLARLLAGKLGYAFLGREEVVARANECGIPVGKLEVAMIKKPSVQERMARLKERYLAVATATICEKAAEGDLVYCGRAGHHLLPGVSHVIRVHVVSSRERRVETAMQRIKLPRDKAETFLSEVDQDIRAWVRFVHHVDIDDPHRYDLVVNLEQISIENAAAALCGIAELPDFRPTPASRRAMEERLLLSRAGIRLALDPRTAEANLTVRSSEGVLTVTYSPRDARFATSAVEVLGGLPGCREIRCTMADTNVLWIEEEFRPGSPPFRDVGELSRRWGAAVELLRYRSDPSPGQAEAGGEPVPASPRMDPETGGIEEDGEEVRLSPSDRLFRETLEALVDEGRSGGGQTVAGGRENLLSAINPNIPYSLVVVGDLFLGKSHAARVRMTRDLSVFLSNSLKAPVISSADLGKKLSFSPSQAVKLAAALALVVLIFAALLTHQESVIGIMGGEAHESHPWIAPVLAAAVVPLVAGLYGFVAGAFLKLIKFE